MCEVSSVRQDILCEVGREVERCVLVDQVTFMNPHTLNMTTISLGNTIHAMAPCNPRHAQCNP